MYTDWHVPKAALHTFFKVLVGTDPEFQLTPVHVSFVKVTLSSEINVLEPCSHRDAQMRD